MNKCEVNSRTIYNGISSDIKKRLLSTGMFVERDGIFYPTQEFGYQDIVNSINSLYKEEILMQLNNQEAFAVVEPSPKLVNQIQEVKVEAASTVSVDIESTSGEDSSNNIYKNGEFVGKVSLYNDGTYLDILQMDITKQKQGIGTEATIYLGDWAAEQGLTLRSDIKDVRMNEGSTRLWDKLVEQGFATFDGTRYIFIKPGNLSLSAVQYKLKASEILASDKAAKMFKKGMDNGWDLSKILSELQIPRVQIDMLLQYNTMDREELLANFMADYSYTVEINTSKESTFKQKPSGFREESEDKIQSYTDSEGNTKWKIINTEIGVIESNFSSKEDALAFIGADITGMIHTSYYSNLTVPGGINYTENEIATPGITPSIKGHAQFATDKGIGWFRSDDRKYTEEIETEELENNEDETSVRLVKSYPEIGGPKTRRILEIQSDLFQKGRDEKKALSWNRYILDEKGDVIGENPRFQSEQDFLNLLRKDNNWVTFFVKSIIQDSIKKGYEKVMFPTGNTASKIEGHTTLEGFKKQKEDRIKELEEDKKKIENLKQNVKKEDLYLEYFGEDGLERKEFDTLEELQSFSKRNSGWENKKIGVLEFGSYKVLDSTENIDREIDQLKRELERVEKEGYAALAPIFRFYENDISNILKKQYKPQLITDEYGNTWNVIELETKQNILLSATSVDPGIEMLQKKGLLSYESIMYDGIEYYKIPNVDGEKNEFARDRIENIIKINDINLSIIETADNFLVQKGKLLEVPSPIDNLSPTTSTKATGITKGRVLRFLENIGFKDIQVVSDLRYRGQKISANAYVDMVNGVMRIVEGKEDYTLPEEAMHILVELVKQSNPSLYKEMSREVVNYKLYRDVLADPAYAQPLYQNEDGTPNYDKLKDEAIAKLLAEYLISNLQDSAETEAKVHRAYTLWQKFVEWIKGLFGQHTNPFEKALSKLDEDDTSFGRFADLTSDGIFLSAKPLSQIDVENKETREIFDRIRNRATELNISKVDATYYKDGQPVEKAKRVSDLVDAYYQRLFGDKTFDEKEKEFYEQSRKDGTYIHEIVEEVIKSLIDEQTGLARRTPGNVKFPLQDNPIRGALIKDLQTYLRKMIASYPQGTRFIVEQIIYDSKNDRYGTIDFQAVVPKVGDKPATVDILDWKSILMRDIEGVKDYKKGAIYVQLNEYKRILKDEYGVEGFGKIRAIPITKSYKTYPSGRKVLQSIEIGDLNPINIEEKWLRPIISPEESTGSEYKDEIVDKLSRLYNKYIEKGYFKNERTILDDVENAIYELRVSNSVDNLANYFEDLSTKFASLLKEGKTIKDTNNKQDLSEILAMISFYEDIVEHIVTPSQFLQKDTSINIESRKKLYDKASQLNFLTKELGELRKEILDQQAKKEGIFDLLLPEKVVNLAARWFRSMGSQDIATVRYMYELVKKAFNRINLEVDNRLKDLADMKSRFEEWRKTNGKTNEDAIGMLVNYENGRLHSKIDKEFFEVRKQVRETKNANEILTFIKKNYNLDEYKQWYEKTLNENIKNWETAVYDVDKKKNNFIIKKKIEQFEKSYNIYKHPITAYGYHNKKIWTKNLKEEKWYSKEYKELLKDENKSLLEIYDKFVSINKELMDIGAIKDYEVYTFLPNIRKDFATIMMQEDKSLLQKAGSGVVNSFQNFRKSLSVEDYELNYQGQVDSFSGEKLNKRFVPYINYIAPKEKSFDIFAIYGLMSKEISKEKYLSENDEILRSLLHIERSKPNLVKNKYNRYDLDSQGRVNQSTKTGANAPIFEEHMKAIVNGESLQQNEELAVIQFKLREKWNNSPLGKMYRFDIDEKYNPTSISGTKFLMWLNSANQKRILGVNAASAISNLFGGSFSSNKLFQKYIAKEDLNNGWTKMTSGAFYSTDEMKKNAALVDFFLPLLNNRESFKASQLSVSEASTILSQEWLMAPMRTTSERVQLNIFFAIMDNTTVINGKLVNIREHLAKEMGYDQRYNLPTAQREQLEKDYKKAVKEMKEKSSLPKIATFTKVQENGKTKTIIEIPGIPRDSLDVANIREITQTMAKDALGEADEWDRSNYTYSLWWRLFMTFKNWIPRQADVRFGEFRYDQAHHSYEYGRLRMFAKAWSANYMQTVAKLIPIPYLTGKVTDAIFSKDMIIQRAKEVYAEKVAETKMLGRYNPDTFITEAEFIDKFIQGTDSTFAEIRTLILMGTLLFAGLASPDDDDDASDKTYKALIRKQVNKLIDEVGFFYSPKSGIDIIGGGFPITGIVRDVYNLGSDVTEQFFGYTFEQIGWDEKGMKMQESAKPIKRTFKVFPVMKEILTYLPAFDEETAKEWGVKVQDKRAF